MCSNAMDPFLVLSLREDSQKEDQDDGPKFLGRRAIGSWVVAHGGLWWWALVVRVCELLVMACV